jgi:hypothetical protein
MIVVGSGAMVDAWRRQEEFRIIEAEIWVRSKSMGER